ncbi:methionine-R-sulfoxide reductase [Emiliania huxleyi CCMP1516]|uniref:MsrB domain-containing protein n=4 Tax=Emiliania huxleyi TaxID=2903 RepID=A0A0D3JDN5_EMIH1|nr:methionine-R-sulfoxide reductase [Emiliania huxleyi CCMP1516]EOD21620.1 methionine-R-sulfoxide reductase [Emiliania huxleyi CCMP1516]|eukprot:XP_005774049.1 methionine-R-sulfoxide reductase [Emiliania huxleyi CCMP1516]
MVGGILFPELDARLNPTATRSPLRLAVLRLGLTEPAWTSPLNFGVRDGAFACAGCSAILFDSSAKFDSGTGWPSFWRTAAESAVGYREEYAGGGYLDGGSVRSATEVHCEACGGHLGHVFLDGPAIEDTAPALAVPPSDPRAGARRPRFCVNGAALRFRARVA